MTPVVACGFEDASLATHWLTTGAPSLVTAAGHTGTAGTRFGRVVTASGVAANIRNPAFTNTASAAFRFWFRIDAYPAATWTLFNLNGVSFYNPRFMMDTSGHIVARTNVDSAAGDVVSLNAWHAVDVKYDGATPRIDWLLDGVAQPTSIGNVADQINQILYGNPSQSVGTITLDVDDVTITLDKADYPIPDRSYADADVEVVTVVGTNPAFPPRPRPRPPVFDIEADDEEVLLMAMSA